MNEADLQNSILMSWKSLPLNEKKHYVELSELESNRFGSEFDDSPQRQYVFYFKFHFDRMMIKKKDMKDRASVIRPPKKVRSAYIYFCLKNRSRIQEENDSISPIDASRRLGEEWNRLTPEEKEVILLLLL